MSLKFSLAGIFYDLPALPSSSSSLSSNAPQQQHILSQLVRGTHLTLFTSLMVLWSGLLHFGKMVCSIDFPGQCATLLTPCFCHGPDQHFRQQKKILLQDVQPSHVVLDVGSGDGVYLSYLTRAKQIVCLEPNALFHDQIRKRASRLGIAETSLIISNETLESYRQHNPEARFDYIILGNVLCEVDDPQLALDCVDQLLREPKDSERGGGKLFFCEHIGCPKHSLLRRVQDLLNPFWRMGMGGCHVNRDSVALIQSQPNWEVFYVEATFVSLQWAVGLARKMARLDASSTGGTQIFHC